MPAVNSLPPEILQKTLRFFMTPNFEDTDPSIFEAMRVCKRWRNCVLEIILGIDTTRIRPMADWWYIMNQMWFLEGVLKYLRAEAEKRRKENEKWLLDARSNAMRFWDYYETHPMPIDRWWAADGSV